MITLNTVLIDDEPDSIRLLTLQLKKYPQVKIIATYTDPLIALQNIEDLKVDMIFLDIEMPGMDGFEFLEKIAHLNLNIVFVTAYNQFALRAFRFNALDYLLKPVDVDDLKMVVEKAEKMIKPTPMQLDMLQKQMRGEPLNKIAIQSQSGITFINLGDIIYAEASSNYTYLVMEDKKKILISKTLKDVQEVLEESHFLRIHRQYIVNLNHVKALNKNDCIITMINDDQLPLARTQKEHLTEKYKWF